MGWKSVPLSSGGGASSDTRVGTTLAELNAGGAPRDGCLGILRPDPASGHDEFLTWNGAPANRWEGMQKLVATQADTWAMDLGNRSQSQLVNWSRFTQAIPYGKAYTVLTSALNTSSLGGGGTVNVAETRPADGNTLPGESKGFDNAGRFIIGDNLFQYTGRTNQTFTGVTWISGSGGLLPVNVDVFWGFPGGIGIHCSPIAYVAEMMAMGFTLEEQLICQLNDEPGNAHKLNVAMYWREFENGVGSTQSDFAVGGIGMSTVLHSAVADDGGAKLNEREFHWTMTDEWVPWHAGVPTMRYMIPSVGGFMDSGATDTGELLDFNGWVRWVG
jgi:hypothetical protein